MPAIILPNGENPQVTRHIGITAIVFETIDETATVPQLHLQSGQCDIVYIRATLKIAKKALCAGKFCEIERDLKIAIVAITSSYSRGGLIVVALRLRRYLCLSLTCIYR